MPELPEVETIRRDLAPRVVGRRFTAVEIFPGAEKVVAVPSPAEFQRALPGLRIEDIERRAGRVEARMNDAKSVARQYKLWLVADIGEAAVSYTCWARRRLASALCGGSFFDGAAFALKRTGSQEIVAGWITGVRDVWDH